MKPKAIDNTALQASLVEVCPHCGGKEFVKRWTTSDSSPSPGEEGEEEVTAPAEEPAATVEETPPAEEPVPDPIEESATP